MYAYSQRVTRSAKFRFPSTLKCSIKFIYFTLYINNGITFVPGQKDHEHAIISFCQIDVKIKWFFYLHVAHKILNKKFPFFLYHISFAFLWRCLFIFIISFFFYLNVTFVLNFKKCVSGVIHLLRIHHDLEYILDKSLNLTGDHGCHIYLYFHTFADKNTQWIIKLP